METGKKIRFAFIVVLWLILCYLLIKGAGDQLQLIHIFSIIASGIIVFVPLYKKYKKKD